MPNYKRIYDQIEKINKSIRALYWEMVLFLGWINGFWYILENDIIGDILDWTPSKLKELFAPKMK